jgi:hypothetical protein
MNIQMRLRRYYNIAGDNSMQFSTYTGKIIDLANFIPEMVCLEDVAHHLTKICRFGGALDLNSHYSVAQHSIEILMYMYENGERDTKLLSVALLHDASEAYLGDVISPVKELIPQYKTLEKRILKVILEKYVGFYCPFMLKKIKDIDKRIVIDEAKTFHPKSVPLFTERNGCKENALGIIIKHRFSDTIKDIYLNWAKILNLHDDLDIDNRVVPLN